MNMTPPSSNIPPGFFPVGPAIRRWRDAEGNDYTRQIIFLENFIRQNRSDIFSNPALNTTGFLPATNWTGVGTHHPGRLFGRTSAYSFDGVTIPANVLTYGSGTYDGRLIPQGYIEQNPNTGASTYRHIGILAFSPALQATSLTQARTNVTQAADELGLVATGTVNGLRTFTRTGYNGSYFERNDGGIFYDGGAHVSGIRPPQQVYYTGTNGTHMWHRLGADREVLPPPAQQQPEPIFQTPLRRPPGEAQPRV